MAKLSRKNDIFDGVERNQLGKITGNQRWMLAVIKRKIHQPLAKKLPGQFRGKNCLDFFYFSPNLKGTTIDEISDLPSRFFRKYGLSIFS